MTDKERIIQLESQLAERDREIAELQGANEQLQGAIGQLQQEVADLRAKMGKDSHNSSKPPSSDGLRKRTRSQRPVGVRKTGGQPGHPGHTLQAVTEPDQVITHRPITCAQCHHDLHEVPGKMQEERQVYDIPPEIRVEVTAHRVEAVDCPECGYCNQGAFPAEVKPGVQYGPEVRSVAVYLYHYQYVSLERTVAAMADQYHIHISEGTLVQWVQAAAEQVTPAVNHIKELVIQCRQAGGDETGIRVQGKLGWLHVASSRWLTHLAWHRKRGRDAMREIGIWPRFYGRAMHDRWASYDMFPCQHRLCKAHLVRDLTFLEEAYQQTWAAEMRELLLAMHAAAREWQARGCSRLPEEERATWLIHYFELLRQGFTQLPPTEPVPKQRGKVKQHPAKNLLDVLNRRADQILGFVEDTSEAFTNNQREQDLRTAKIHEHVSGGFRSEAGATAFCLIRSYVATLRKQGHRAFDAIRSIFRGPLIPVAWGLE